MNLLRNKGDSSPRLVGFFTLFRMTRDNQILEHPPQGVYNSRVCNSKVCNSKVDFVEKSTG